MSKILTIPTGVHISSKGEILTPEVATDVVALLECSDYYLAHPPMQPKHEIADYVEFQGLRVPKRYKNLDEALKSGKDFIMRSEHPQDYDGVSGLFESEIYYMPNPIVTQESIKQDKKKILEIERVREYCRHTGKDYYAFVAESSFEFWEYIEGENLTVVRDEVVEGRYHIFVKGGGGSDYICYASGDVLQGNITENIGVENIERLIDKYEQISHLGRFDALQCPNIEFQLGKDGNIYFLQYKRGHQKELQKWTLDRELEDGEIEANFVRGVTQRGGKVYSITYREGMIFDSSINGANYYTGAIPEYYTKNQCVIQQNSDSHHGLDFHGFVAHISQSSICIHIRDFIPSLLDKMDIDFFLDRNNNSSLPEIGIDVIIESDGSRAIVKLDESPKSFLEKAKIAGYPDRELSYYERVD